MKSIIDGKLYDTEKSELSCEYSYSNPGDFQYVYEALYKSPNGKYFIEYGGGAMSKYGESCGQNEATGSSGIRLMDEDEAKDFTEAHGTAEDYAKAFGEPELG